MSKKPTKLGNSTNVTIGKKSYSSYDVPNLKPQTKEVRVKSGMENAPRNIVQKSVENQANTVKTNNQAQSANTNPAHVKTSTQTTTPPKAGGVGGDGNRNNQRSDSTKPSVQNSTVSTNQSKPKVVVPNASTPKSQTTVIRTESKSDTTPRNLSRKSVDNQANVVRTNTVSSEGGKSIKTASPKSQTEKPTSVLLQTASSKVEKSPKETTTLNTSKTKVQASVTLGGEQKDKAKSNIQRQTAITVSPKTIISSKPVVRGFQRPTSAKAGVLTNIKNKVHNSLDNENDSGASTLSTAMTASGVSVKTFKAAQTASPHVVKAAQGTYNVGVKTIKVVKAANSTLANIKNGTIQLNRQTMLQFKAVAVQKVMNTEPMKRITHAVGGIRTAVDGAKRYSVMLSQGTMKAVSVTRGIVNGTVKIQVSKEALRGFRNAAFKGIGLSGRMVGTAVKTGAVNGLKTGLWGLKNGGRAVLTGVIGAGDMLSNTDDTGVQALGLGIKTTHLTARAIKTSPRVIKQGAGAVKAVALAPVKTGKAIYRTGKGVAGMAKMVSKIGIKDTVKYYRTKMLRAIARAGNSAVSAIVQAFRTLGMKAVIPALIILIIIVGASSLATAPIAGVGTIFGGAFTNKDTNTDYEIHAYLTTAVEPKKDALVAKILKIRDDALVSNGGNYHYVRLFTATDDKEIDISRGSILGAIYTSEELVTLIEPLFQSIMLTEYGLEPTQAEIDSTLKEIFDSLIKVSTKELPIEYCGGATSPHSCGSYHADVATCPNMESGTHGSYTCSSCCYLYCNGHSYTCGNENCGGHTSYCSPGCQHACNGYHYCRGHRILGIYIDMDGFYELMAKYFTDPIDQLANLASRTPEQEEKLQTLKDNYELTLSYMEIVLENYGVNLGNTDISGVVFVNGSRPPNQAIIDIATMQLGNVGGKPFWSWYGFSSRVEWCATFVSWCSNQLGYISDGTVPKFCSCRVGAAWFRDHGQWAAGGGSYAPVAGDIIFFDWDGDGAPNHVGLVVGNDGSRVYTIEGNSGDVCRRKSYSLNSSVILGYGLPNY